MFNSLTTNARMFAAGIMLIVVSFLSMEVVPQMSLLVIATGALVGFIGLVL